MGEREDFQKEQIAKVARKRSRPSTSSGQDLFEKTEKETDKTKDVSPAMAAARSAANGGGVSDIATTAAFASKNPYAIGGALGLSAISSILGKRQEDEQLAYQNKVSALNNLMSFSKGLGAL